MSYAVALEDDLRWREAELASLKHQVRLTSPNSVPFKALLRALWAMLYAHYEGFCLYSIGTFLEHVEKSQLPRQGCIDSLMLFSLDEHFRRVRKLTPPAAEFYKFCAFDFPTLVKDSIKFEATAQGGYALAGTSNLYPDDLLGHYATLGFTGNLVLQNRARLWQLVKRRNGIAHGEQVFVADIAEYQPYETAVFEVMHELAVTVIDALDKVTYRK